MKIAVINDIHIGASYSYRGQMRAASHLAEERLPELLALIMTKHSPDCLVNLGDLIRSESEKVDTERYIKALTAFQKLSCPIIHLIGNHELKQMTPSSVQQCWKDLSIEQSLFGTKVIKGMRLIWLGMRSAQEYEHYLPKEQVEWLSKMLRDVKEPTLLFVHCAIDEQNLQGNFFFEEFEESRSSPFFLRNQLEIRALLRENKLVRGVFQGHLHHFHIRRLDDIPYITCPAMVENICGPEMQNNFPEIYTILDIGAEDILVKCYAREHAFAGAEL